eukprot:gene2016-1973_t
MSGPPPLISPSALQSQPWRTGPLQLRRRQRAGGGGNEEEHATHPRLQLIDRFLS